MRIYYYHTRPIKEAYQEWKDNRHPGHILYGLTHFRKYDVDTIWHPFKSFSNRIAFSFYNLRKILFCKEEYDILYGTSFRGIELLIFLRALGLYRKPIVIWHHQPVIKSSNFIWETVSRLFYKGIDKMFFFSDRLIEDSLKTGKVKADRVKLIHWGADLEFYHNLEQAKSTKQEYRYISTGKENRDFPTLLSAFEESIASIDIFTAKSNGDKNYENILEKYVNRKNKSIRIHFVEGIIPFELAAKVRDSFAVVICSLPYNYTVGLTTLVEAMALGKPVIVSKNPFFQMDIEKEGIGITVEYGDVQGWVKAIDYIDQNDQIAREMGERSRKLAYEQYNLEIYTQEIISEFHSVISL